MARSQTLHLFETAALIINALKRDAAEGKGISRAPVTAVVEQIVRLSTPPARYSDASIAFHAALLTAFGL